MNLKFVITKAMFYLAVMSNLVFGQYELKSQYLINPDLNIGYVDSCAAF